MPDYDATIVGAGPNGLAAAITLARAGWRVVVFEANNYAGGALSSTECTLPGFVHDRGSAIHPLGVGSPFFRSLPLADYGVRWIYPPVPVAHPLDQQPAVLLQRSVAATAAALDPGDSAAYQRLFGPLTRFWQPLVATLLHPLIPPKNPLALAAFGVAGGLPVSLLARILFRGERARALLAGLGAHSVLPLTALGSAASGLLLGMLGHAVGWPFPQGGAGALSTALVAYLRDLGGEVILNSPVSDLTALPKSRATLLSLTPRQILQLTGTSLPDHYRHALGRYRYSPGAYKVDYALDGPIPWRDPACYRAGTLHLGNSLNEIMAAEQLVADGGFPGDPYVLVAQHTLFDPSRAPAGKQTAWAYCHVPHGSTRPMVDQIETQIERYAPGFRARILARTISDPLTLERMNANLVGGDIGGGSSNIMQLVGRPTVSLRPYRTPTPGLYLCSAATPPGGGVHGMAGNLAAQAVLYDYL